MKKAILIPLVLMVVGIASAANIPSGLTGLWRFPDSANKLKATVGVDLVNSDTNNAPWMSGPWTMLGVAANAGLYADGGIIMDRSWDYLTVNPSFTANGGGSYVNEYTILWDVNPDPGLNSLYQTAYGPHDDDGDLWINATTRAASTVGVDAVGFSTSTFDGNTWHRIVLAVKNGSFFRVYVDGVLYLDGAGQSVDGRFSLYPDRFHLFADDSWQDAWIRCGMVAVWNRALTGDEIAAMGGWTGGATTPTALLFSDAPEFLSVSPLDGDSNVAPDIAYQARILDPAGVLPPSSVQLLLDGVPASPVVTHSEAMLTVTLGGGLLQGGTAHTYTLIGGGSGLSFTDEVTFAVANYTSYEWRFTNGDLSSALGNGTMTYADPSSTPGLTSFGTTDGSTVPHINGSPAKYMHVPGFTFDTDGYQLQFNDSGPNVGTHPYINRYTLLFDMLLPNLTAENDPDYIVPFFNTDPYNLNDADSYLCTDGSVGIGYAGYSAANVVKPNEWFRLAFVADLAANTLTYYVDGTNVHSGSADGLEGRWALYSNQDAGPDLLLFNEGDTSGVYTHQLYVSSVAFADRVLSPAEIAALGGPSANGILAPSFTTRPTLAIQKSEGGATLSWSPGYVGYRLEQADSLAAPQWKAVAGVTNNAAVVPASATARFFRLAQ